MQNCQLVLGEEFFREEDIAPFGAYLPSKEHAVDLYKRGRAMHACNPALGRQKQEDQKIQVIIPYMASSRLTWSTEDSV